MKRKNILLVLMLALMAPVSAWAQTTYSWGSSSTNSGGATYANPFGRLFGWEYRVFLYPPNTMPFAGNISKLEFLPKSTLSSSGGQIDVWMKTTTTSSLSSSTTFATYKEGATLVYSNSSSPSYTADSYVSIPLSTSIPYNYNNNEYLMILVRSVASGTSGDGGGDFYYYNPSGASNNTWYKKQDSSDPGQSVSGSTAAYLPVIRVTYTTPPTTMTCGQTYSGTLGTSGIWNSYPGCSYSDDGEEKIYAFTPTVSGSHTFHGNETSGDPDFWLLSTPDNTGTNLIGSCWNSGDKTVSLTAGTTVYLIVDNYSSSNSAGYSVSVTCPTTYTVTYYANGGSGTMTDSNSPYVSGSTVTVMSNAFTAPSGKTFSGWNTASDGSGTSYDPNDTFTISANTTLYAQWVDNCPAQSVPFSENFNSSSSLPSCWTQEYDTHNLNWTIESNNSYGTGSNAAKLYQGSSSGGNYTTKLITPKLNLDSYSSATLTFKHTQVVWSSDQDQLCIYYRTSPSASWVQLGSCYTSNITAPGTTETFTLPAAACTSTCQIAFEGHANYGRGVYVDDVSVTPSYTVTYDANGGTGTMTDPNSPYVSGSTVTVMSNAFTASSGMTFSGWNTAANGSGTSYAAGDQFNISANTILYAQWTVDCDYYEDFEGVTGTADYETAGLLPTGWNYIWNYSSNPEYAPHVYLSSQTDTPGLPSTGNYLGFYASGSTSQYSYAIMPAVAANEAVNHISFKYKFESTSKGTLTYGVINGTDESSYTILGTISSPSSNPGTVDAALDVSQTADMRIAFRWDKSSTWYTCGIDDICVTTETVSNCPKPTNVTASNLTINSAHISWDGEADSYNVRYATATVSGTTLDPVFEDGFESGLGNWTTYANGYVSTADPTAFNNTNWHQMASSSSVTPHTGSYVAMSRSYDGEDRSVDNWLVSPQMTLGDVVKFWVCGDNANWQEYYTVYVSVGTNAISDFVLLATPALAPGDGSWAERTVQLGNYAGQQGYVAIRHTDTGKDYLFVDDFGVYNTVNSYSYGTWQNVTPSPTTTSCDITGLSAETLYAVQVQADCGTDGTSSWGSVYFTTPDACGAPTNLVSSNITATTATLGWADNQDSYNVRYRKVYFYEGFEGETLPTGWTTIDANNDGLTWGTGHATAHSGHNGAYNVSYVYSSDGSVNTTPDDYLVSPQLDLQGTLRVWLSGYARSNSNYSEHFEILLSTTGTSASDFTTILVGETTTTNGYVEYTADLNSYTGQGYIAIHHFNCTDQYYLYVDDFGIYGSENWVSVTPNPTDATTTLTGLQPNTDYEWQVQGIDCDGNGHTTDWSATANFTTSNGYIITATADPSGNGTFAFTGSGVASSNATSAVVNPNGDVTITATATAGYTFMNWIEGGSVVSTTNAYALTGVNASHDLTAHFVDMTASNTWPAAVTTLAAATPGYSVDGSTITISNANGLAWLISTVNGLNSQSGTAITSSTVINLTADVDMSAHIWVPIGTTEHPFVGTFNGNGHTISGVNRALEFPNQGVFGYVSGGTIHDVVVNTNITGDCNYMGSVAGTLASGTVYNTGSTGTVTANANTIAVGGTVGYNGGLVHSSFATGTFTGLAGDYVGGLVGENAPAGRLYNSYSNTTVNTGNGAGLVGYNAGTVANCYTNGVPNMGVAYIHTNKASGVVEYVYGDKTPFYYLTMETGHTLRYHGSSFSSVQSDIKHLDYMYRDNAITLAGGQTSSYVPSSVSYDNNHTVKWNGLVSALNQWVADNKTSGVAIGTLSSWYRPLTTAINGDLPVLGFGGETTLGTANGSPKTLKYGTMDELLTTYSGSTASIFHYGKATEVTHVPTANVNVYIDEDAVLLQATNPDPGPFINTTVGVTFDNSDHGTHAYDYWGNKLNYDWHFMSTPLSDAKIGATYNDYVAHGFGSDIDIKALVNSYFPNNLPMALHDANWRWDFYTYYEPEYHWINLKRNKNNHYHVDGGWSISYNYIADDQAVGDAASLACVFIPGKGYMMAISKDVFMNSTGTLNRGNVPIRLTLKEPGDINYASGWNLVGNPYQAYLNINALNRNLYIYDADQGVYAPYAPAASDNPATPSQYIHPHQAFFVHAASDGEELIFTPSMASTETTPYSYYRDDRIDYPLVNLYVENNAGQRDLTVVEFHRPELGGARKLETMRNAPFTLAAHYAGISYGILFATDDIERIPVRFETDENGWVTLTWSTHNGEFSKLLLIDNKLGVEHNMLADNSYTFEASPDDYSSRFYIVYDCSGMGVEENEESGASTGSATAATFAYINNGNIVIDIGSGHGASIQVIDVLGRVLYSKTIAGTDVTYTVSTKGLAKGVYLIRLADGHNVKTQKLVVQ